MLDSMREWALFLLRRFGVFLIALFGVSVITFTVTHKIGNPVYLLVGTRYNQEMLDNIRREIGLDRPLHEQYLRYAGNLLQGNLGISRFSYNPVLEEIGRRLPATLELSTWALAMGVLWAVPGRYHGRPATPGADGPPCGPGGAHRGFHARASGWACCSSSCFLRNCTGLRRRWAASRAALIRRPPSPAGTASIRCWRAIARDFCPAWAI